MCCWNKLYNSIYNMFSLPACHILMSGQNPLASLFNAHSIAFSCKNYVIYFCTFTDILSTLPYPNLNLPTFQQHKTYITRKVVKVQSQVFTAKTDQISTIYKEQRKLLPALRHAFLGALNNGTNTSNLTSANIRKLRCVIHLNTLLPFCV